MHRLTYFLFLFVLFISFTVSVFAEDISFGVATFIPMTQKDIANGSIISSTSSGFIVAKRAYDPLVFGVVAQNPAVSFGANQQTGKYPVISTGQAYVLVNTQNGGIKRGDLITTSSTPGVGMKATKSGFVLGNALESFSARNPNQSKAISISLDIHYFATKATISSQLLDLFNFSFLAASDEPTTFIKYVIALLIIVLSFILGLFSFGRIAANGIEALGRNPLAGRMIQLGIIFNVIITVAIIGGGILSALFILKL